jgi:serine/threonine protein kinase
MAASFPVATIPLLGKYELIENLGEGYLGSVYRGFDRNLGQTVAVRVLCDGIKWDARVEELFHQACQAISGLHHPNIVAILDAGMDGSSRYIAMESLGNRNIGDLIAQKADLTYETKLAIIIQIAEGLSCAHKNGILHLDLTPGKIHPTADGGVKIRDFGIAHVLMKHLPRPIVRWGAPMYLSPEQIQQKSCDARSDIFSAGTIFYELLTGHHPFHDSNSNKALDNILLDAQIPTFEEFPDAPPGIWNILKTCLARDPEDRYQSVEDVLIACRELAVSLAEDSQLMLAELYAALTPLRRAAAQPDASERILRLQSEIQKLSSGKMEADYASLDRLTRALIEHYPVIHSAPDRINSIHLQFPSTETETVSAADVPEPVERPSENGEIASVKQYEGNDRDKEQSDLPPALNKPIECDEGPHTEQAQLETPSSNETHAAVGSADRIVNPSSEEAMKENPEGCLLAESSTLQTVFPVVQDAETAVEAELIPEADGIANPEINPSDIVTGKLPIQEHRPASRFRHWLRPSYRTTVLLLSILIIAVAGYIAWGTEARPVRNTWNLLMANSPATLKPLIPQGRFSPSDRANDAAANNTAKQTLSDKHSSVPMPEPVPKGAGEEISANQEKADNQIKSKLSGVTFLINSGKLPQAKAEIDRLQAIDPVDPKPLELHRQIETGSAAKATLTVHRLGASATLLLDGRPIGKEGEIENETIPAGNHTLAIANDGGLVASRGQQYLEGQRVAFIYDLAKLHLRPMAESDRELLAQRKAMEAVHTFELDHDHGLLRGSCRGVLSVDLYDIAYKPSSGWHGFRMPFKLLRIGRVEGRSVELFYISDGKHFQTFKLPDDPAVEQFKQVWSNLKNLAR